MCVCSASRLAGCKEVCRGCLFCRFVRRHEGFVGVHMYICIPIYLYSSVYMHVCVCLPVPNVQGHLGP